MSKGIIRFSAVICLTTLLIKWTNSYVLLAANLEDFKKVAKKFVPEKLAMQIAEIATANSAKKVSRSVPYSIPQPEHERVQEEIPTQEELAEESGQAAEEEQVALKDNLNKYLREGNRPNLNQNEDNPAIKQMDFEDLVQQVKKRIEQDILKKQTSEPKQQKQTYTEMEPEYSEKGMVEKTQPERTYEERNPSQQDRVAKNPERDSPKSRIQSYKQKEIRKPRQKYSPDEYYDEKTPEKTNPQEKMPERMEESYIDQEQQNPRQQSQIKQFHYGEKQTRYEISKVNERPNENQQKSMHDQDEIDMTGKVVHNQQQMEKQRQVKVRPKYTPEKQLRTVSPDPHGYKEGRYKEKQEPEEDDDGFFKKINMTRQDSYEDYEMPKKEENPYASNESNLKVITRSTKGKANSMDIVLFAAKAPSPIDYEEGEKNDYYNDDSENLKARTENLGMIYDAYQETERQSGHSAQQTTPMSIVPKALGNKKDKNRGKATMIPKRDFYKLSSPNYYGKIPIVAEKYDFNEPIPEKDREPEDTRSFPMPPSAINGKVRL